MLSRNSLKKQNLTTKETVEILTRHLANSQIVSLFNEINYRIWGSQVELLQHLNSSSGSSVTELKTVYDLAISRSLNPSTFAKYTFEQYLQFLVSHKLVTEIDGSYFISQLGRDFLMYLIATGTPRKGL